MKKIIAVLVVTMLIFTGCGKSKDEELEAKVAELEQQVAELSKENVDSIEKTDEVDEKEGYFKGNDYFNDFLGFSFSFPETWEIQGKDHFENMSEVGTELIVGDDNNLREQFETAEDKFTIFRLVATKYPYGTPSVLNPNIGFMGQSVSTFAGVTNEEDYIKGIKELFKKSEMDIVFTDGGSKSLDGHEFKVVHITMMIGEIKVEQDMYVRLEKGVALAIVVNYFDEESKNEVYDVLNSGYSGLN